MAKHCSDVDVLFGSLFFLGAVCSSAVKCFAYICSMKKKLNVQTHLITIIMRLEHLYLCVFACIIPLFSSYYANYGAPGVTALAVSNPLCMFITAFTILPKH
jgi:hypothetical protein